jgi:hypothetical protein
MHSGVMVIAEREMAPNASPWHKAAFSTHFLTHHEDERERKAMNFLEM